jgi:alcohol dehydrogenase (cytochrome c)
VYPGEGGDGGIQQGKNARRRCPLAQAVATPLVAGVAVTSGGVLCTGDLTNDFLAINASNGETLYRFNTGGAVGGGVITYEMDGKQYVATMSGVVSGFFGGTGTSAVVVFALP